MRDLSASSGFIPPQTHDQQCSCFCKQGTNLTSAGFKSRNSPAPQKTCLQEAWSALLQQAVLSWQGSSDSMGQESMAQETPSLFSPCHVCSSEKGSVQGQCNRVTLKTNTKSLVWSISSCLFTATNKHSTTAIPVRAKITTILYPHSVFENEETDGQSFSITVLAS